MSGRCVSFRRECRRTSRLRPAGPMVFNCQPRFDPDVACSALLTINHHRQNPSARIRRTTCHSRVHTTSGMLSVRGTVATEKVTVQVSGRPRRRNLALPSGTPTDRDRSLGRSTLGGWSRRSTPNARLVVAAATGDRSRSAPALHLEPGCRKFGRRLARAVVASLSRIHSDPQPQMAQMTQMEWDEAVFFALPAESPNSGWPAKGKNALATPPICVICHLWLVPLN